MNDEQDISTSVVYNICKNFINNHNLSSKDQGVIVGFILEVNYKKNNRNFLKRINCRIKCGDDLCLRLVNFVENQTEQLNIPSNYSIKLYNSIC